MTALANHQEQQSQVANRDLSRGSFSAGIAQFLHHGHALVQLLPLADRGLYQAKEQGSARIEVATLNAPQG